MTEQRERLKQFIEDNFDFYQLKKIGFWPKGTRITDYEKIAKRICRFFELDSIYDYSKLTPIFSPEESATEINGKMPDTIDKHGKFKMGGGFHLDTVETKFTCPICTCEQDASEHDKYNKAKIPIVTIRCKGCKRQLILSNDIRGNLTVEEK